MVPSPLVRIVGRFDRGWVRECIPVHRTDRPMVRCAYETHSSVDRTGPNLIVRGG